MVFKLSTEVKKEDMVCITSDIAAHFILDCIQLYSSRDRMIDGIVNVLNVQNYVDLTTLDDNKIVNSILVSKRYAVIPEDEWEIFMTAVASGQSQMMTEMSITTMNHDMDMHTSLPVY
jgi:hypothetical protein